MHDAWRLLKLNLLHVGFVQLDRSWRFDKVISPFSRLYLITDGEGWVFHNNQKHILKPGYMYLIPSFTFSRYHCDEYLEQYYISLLEETEGGLSIYETNAFVYEVKAVDLDYRLFSRLLELNPGRSIVEIDPKTYDNRPDLLSFNLPKSDQSLKDYIESCGIMHQLISRFLSDDPEIEKRKKSLHSLASTLQYINSRLHEKITVHQLAEDNYLSPDYFSRLFRSIVGVSPMNYIVNKRLERAQLLLSTTNTPLREIAEMVGIPDIYYFSRLFKRQFKIPPGKYRATQWRV